jgi:hypothetical protein
MNGSNATNNTQGGRQGFPFLFRFCSIFVPLNVDFCCVFAVVFCSDSAPSKIPANADFSRVSRHEPQRKLRANSAQKIPNQN